MGSAATADVISVHGFTAAEEQAAVKNETAAANGVVGTQITLSDHTKVTFVDAAASTLTFRL